MSQPAIRVSIIGGLAVALASCASVANEPANSAGPYPNNYEEIIKKYLHDTLKDPYSIQKLKISKPVEKTVFAGALAEGTIPAYASCVSYNAKNSYGGYIGVQSYTYYLRNDAVFINALGIAMVKDGCAIG
jgi:hypothetical protein